MAVPKSKRSKSICKSRRSLQINQKLIKRKSKKFISLQILNQKILYLQSIKSQSKIKLSLKKRNLFNTIY